MGNFMPITKSCGAQRSPGSSLSLQSRTDGTQMQSIRSTVNTIEAKNADIFNRKRRIGDNICHNLLEVHKCLHAHQSINLRSSSSSITRSTFAKHQPRERSSALFDHSNLQANDSRRKEVLIQDNANNEGEERCFYRQGTPHPMRKRISMNSKVLIADDDDCERKKKIDAANIRFNAGHLHECDSLDENTAVNNFIDATQRGKKFGNDSFLNDSQEGFVLSMNVDLVNDENISHETSKQHQKPREGKLKKHRGK